MLEDPHVSSMTHPVCVVRASANDLCARNSQSDIMFPQCFYLCPSGFYRDHIVEKPTQNISIKHSFHFFFFFYHSLSHQSAKILSGSMFSSTMSRH